MTPQIYTVRAVTVVGDTPDARSAWALQRDDDGVFIHEGGAIKRWPTLHAVDHDAQRFLPTGAVIVWPSAVTP